MSKKIIQSIVILLAILIVICFVALILGMYLKITGNQNNSQHNIKDFSLGLSNNEKIVDMIDVGIIIEKDVPKARCII